MWNASKLASNKVHLCLGFGGKEYYFCIVTSLAPSRARSERTDLIYGSRYYIIWTNSMDCTLMGTYFCYTEIDFEIALDRTDLNMKLTWHLGMLKTAGESPAQVREELAPRCAGL